MATPQNFELGADRCKEILAAIFWDLNVACYLPKIVQEQPEQTDWKMNEEITASATRFIDHTFTQMASSRISSVPEQNYTDRVLTTVQRLGWKMFSICSHSEAFQTALQNEGDTEWDLVLTMIEAEQRSIEVFARTRDLDWRGPLLCKTGDEWQGLLEVLVPGFNLATDHPHHVIQTQDGGLRRPVYPWVGNGKFQVCIPQNFIRNHYQFEDGKHPLKRDDHFHSCLLCEGYNCQCQPIYPAGDFVELREYPGKGVGTRSLANLPSLMHIGEFKGEVRNLLMNPTGNIWMMQAAAFVKNEDGNYEQLTFDYNVVVDPIEYGSWARFTNHHCDEYNTAPFMSVIGGHGLIAFQTQRDIAIFEEITISYGAAYWASATGRECMCGGKTCVSHPKKEE